ncbi:MAG: hypothetical protein HZC41_01980 [Chloroflexi bacterium]|nr:hypothetical protein [Chloroflexota bacterium]
MELPFHLRALPPEALDVLRFFSRLEEPIAHATYIMDELGLSERAFGKVVRRLVTKGYLQMGGDQIYRLTDFGYSSVEELAAYDEETPPEPLDDSQPMIALRQIFRRLVLVTPRPLVTAMPTPVQVGFNRAAEAFPQPVEMVVRLSLVHGDSTRPQECSFNLTDEPAFHTFQVTPGRYTQMRLRLQVYQLGDNPDDIAVAGGMYVDVPVVASAPPGRTDLAAYGADIRVTA